MIKYIFCLSFLLLLTCSEESEPTDTILNVSDQYQECNDILSECFNGNGDYCLFGFKWGASNPFSPAGFESPGPREAGGMLTFSFQEENGNINTHSQIDLPSRSFQLLPDCAKAEIRKALNDWAAVADIDFVEMPENSDSDIRFFVADIRQSGIGYPNYPAAPCNTLGGNVVIKSNVQFSNCQTFYLFLLHEIGHVLGLGHVGSANIMNPQFTNFNLTGLQPGDIQGVIEIYGEN